MVAVAIMALAFEAEAWRRRYPYCQSRAARSVEIERSHLWMADSHEKIAALYRRRAADPRESARYNNEQAVIFARAARTERAKAKRAADRGTDYRRAALNPWLPITPDDVPYLRDKEKELNGVLAADAAAAGATYVDVYGPSLGHDACQLPGVRWVEPLIPLAPAAPVHPNALGMQGMAGVLVAAMAR